MLECVLQKLDPKSDGAARDWVAIYDECSRILYEEINYVQEVRLFLPLPLHHVPCVISSVRHSLSRNHLHCLSAGCCAPSPRNLLSAQLDGIHDAI